jgi:hypothetical protein
MLQQQPACSGALPAVLVCSRILVVVSAHPVFVTSPSHLQERKVDASVYSTSTIVKTSAPTELGALRKADGDEGFDAGAAKPEFVIAA